MSYLKNEIIAFVVILLSIMTEYFHLLFLNGGKQIYHSQKILENKEIRIYYLDDLVYFFVNELFTLFIITVIAFKIWKSPGSKSLMSGIFFWYFIEFMEITLQLFKKIDIRTETSGASVIQLAVCLTVSFCVLYMNRKKIS